MTGPTDEVTVLAVDDEPLFLDLYRAWLGDACSLRVAETGDEALRKLDESVTVALLDRRMAGRNGDSTLAAIRERENPPRVALVTAVEPDLDVVDLAFDEYVTKPTDRETITSVVERLAELDACESRVRAFYRAASKRNALRAHVLEDELAASEAYDALTDRVESLAEQLMRARGDLLGDAPDPARHSGPRDVSRGASEPTRRADGGGDGFR